MEKNTIHVVRDSAALANAAAELVTRIAQEAAATRGRFTIALAGGSTPRAAYEQLAQPPYRDALSWPQTHIFWGDERFVPRGHPDRNEGMARAAWLNHVPIPPENIHSVSVEHGDPPAVAAAYEQEIRAVFGLAPGELPRFDLVLLGLGEDGHTASLFPGTPALQERERLVVACFVDRLNVWRITMTAPAINAAAHIVFLVSGQSKAQVLREVLSSQYQPERLPAQLISPINGTLIWLVDSAAAGSHSYAGNGGAS